MTLARLRVRCRQLFPTSRFPRVVVTTVLMGVIGFVLGSGVYLAWFANQSLTTQAQLVSIPTGTSLKGVAQTLQARDIIDQPWAFELLARLKGHGHDLKAGEYRFAAGITPREILDQVVSGRVVAYQFTIIEGWSFAQIRRALAQTPKLEQLTAEFDVAAIMARLDRPDQHPEGRFFPETYQYTAGMSDAAILKQAYMKMEAFLADAWPQRAADLPLKTADEALVLASIVEKETGRADERGMIAGVFINRLNKGMRLQTDPTVIYGIGPKFDGNLRRRDLRRDTPYNTYTRSGLPPTPIAMPGADAITAVLHPTETRALYFVARGDGSHQFSETLAEHNKAVIKYQLGGKPRKFSTFQPQSSRDATPGGSIQG